MKLRQFRRIGQFVCLAALLFVPRAHAQTLLSTTTVDSIADLRLVNPSTYPVVNVLDYYSSVTSAYNRGRGGGMFRWLNSANTNTYTVEDGGRWIESTAVSRTNGIWERVFNGEIPNVKMWGAKGDSTNNDTVAIQKAIDSVNLYGRKLLFPLGTYLITNTLTFGGYHLLGEGPLQASNIKMAEGITNKNILQVFTAEPAFHPGLAVDIAHAGWTNSYGLVTYSGGMLIENLGFVFGDSPWDNPSETGSAICFTPPTENVIVRNIFVTGGGIGIRSLGTGTPGLRAEHCSFFYQAIAGICIEGLQGLSTMEWGPMSLNQISGDLMDSHTQPYGSLILFSNCWPTATITDLSAEGVYGKGIIRCFLPATDNAMISGHLHIHGGSIDCPGSDLVTIVNTNSLGTNAWHTPIVSIEPGTHYNLHTLIHDEWTPRDITTGTAAIVNPNRTPITYESSYYFRGEKNSRLVMGDTAYQWFIPNSNGWWRVSDTYNGQITGGHISINSYWDASSYDFQVTPGYPDLHVTRTSKNYVITPRVTKVRAFSYYLSSAGYRGATEIFVENLPDGANDAVNEIAITMPVDGRPIHFTDKVDLITPRYTGDTNSASGYSSMPYEAVNSTTGPVSLLR